MKPHFWWCMGQWLSTDCKYIRGGRTLKESNSRLKRAAGVRIWVWRGEGKPTDYPLGQIKGVDGSYLRDYLLSKPTKENICGDDGHFEANTKTY